MKNQGSILFWTLGAAAAVYYVFLRAPAPAPQLNQMDVANPNTIPGVSGAPVPNLATTLAVDQNSLFNRILSYFRGGSSSSTSSGTSSSSSSSSTATSSGPGPAVPPNTTGRPFFGSGSTPPAQAGPGYDQAILGLIPGVPGLPLSFQNPSGGFSSGAYHALTISDLF